MQNSSVMNKHSQVLEEKMEWAKFWISKGLSAVEELLSRSSGKFCVGDSVTLADCCLVPQVYNANIRFEVDMSNFPNINQIVKNLEQIDAVIASHPDNQQDKEYTCFSLIIAHETRFNNNYLLGI